MLIVFETFLSPLTYTVVGVRLLSLSRRLIIKDLLFAGSYSLTVTHTSSPFYQEQFSFFPIKGLRVFLRHSSSLSITLPGRVIVRLNFILYIL
jgi:hypothetical protein